MSASTHSKVNQPIAKISTEDLHFLIEREFPGQNEVVKEKLNQVISDSQNGKNRIAACILKLADRDFNQLDDLIEQANEDFRDIVSRAEYPRASRREFNDLSQEESQEDYRRDWEDFSTWKAKKESL